MSAQILCIGQSDSCAGTGIQADVKTAMAFGCYAATAVTAVVVQNTHGVYDTHFVPADIVTGQIDAVMEDLQPSVIKTGMLANWANIKAVGNFMHEIADSNIQIVIDPVMTARGGNVLLDKEARDEMKRSMMIYADVLTPNVHEAEYLTGMTIHDVDEMCHAAEMLMTLGPRIVILKGGSLAMKGDRVFDVLADAHGVEIHQNERRNSRATHGAGTTLSAGLAAGMARGLSVKDAFTEIRAFLNHAIEEDPCIGSGYSPVNHLAGMRMAPRHIIPVANDSTANICL